MAWVRRWRFAHYNSPIPFYFPEYRHRCGYATRQPHPPLPTPPRAVGSEECCQSGCAICVYDVYAQQVSHYLDELKAIQVGYEASHQQVPENVIEARKAMEQDIKQTPLVGSALQALAWNKQKHDLYCIVHLVHIAHGIACEFQRYCIVLDMGE